MVPRVGNADGVIVTVAPTGAEVDRSRTQYLPLSPDEIATEVARSVDAGASMAHLHARTSQGRPTTDPHILGAIIETIDERVEDVVINVSTGAEVGMSLEERAQVLGCDAEVASLNLGTINFGDEIFDNPVPLVRDLAKRMQEKGITPELETYELGMFRTARILADEGLIAPDSTFNFVLGTAGGAPAMPEVLDLFVRIKPSLSLWFATGIGRFQFPVAAEAIVRGGHVRVGFEDNVYLHREVLATSNAQLVEKAVQLAESLGRSILSPAETRVVLGLPPRPSGTAT